MIEKFDFQNLYVHFDNNFCNFRRARKGNKEIKRTKGSVPGPLQELVKNYRSPFKGNLGASEK